MGIGGVSVYYVNKSRSLVVFGLRTVPFPFAARRSRVLVRVDGRWPRRSHLQMQCRQVLAAVMRISLPWSVRMEQ